MIEAAQTSQPSQHSGQIHDLVSRYDKLNLGCGEDHRDDWLDVDLVAAVDPDVRMDITETPWPFPRDSFDRILASHVIEHLADPVPVLRECARVLRSTGRLDVRLPIGADAVTDPDHETVWRWDTPERYCGQEPWDVDVGLRVVTRAASVWSHYPGWAGFLHELTIRARHARFAHGRWKFSVPATSGEFRVLFRPSIDP